MKLHQQNANVQITQWRSTIQLFILRGTYGKTFSTFCSLLQRVLLSLQALQGGACALGYKDQINCMPGSRDC